MPVTRVFITRDGKIVVEGIGYMGPRCEEDAEKLQQLLQRLGVEVRIEARERKPEYYQQQAEVVAEQ